MCQVFDRKKIFSFLFLSLAISAFNARAVAAKPDILGLSLGMTRDQAQVAMDAIEDELAVSRSIPKPIFRDPESTYVPWVLAQKNTMREMHYVLAEFSPDPDETGTFRILRYKRYSPDNAITMAQLRAALTEKYGEPSGEGPANRMNIERMHWIYGPDGEKNTYSANANELRYCNAFGANGATSIAAGAVNPRQGALQYSGNNPIRKPYCVGLTTLSVVVTPLSSNKELVNILDVSLLDFDAGERAVEWAKQWQQNKVDRARQQQLDRAQSKKPAL